MTSRNGTDPMALSHEAMDATVDRALDEHIELREQLVTRPAVGHKKSRDDERLSYLGVRNNAYELGALVAQYGLRRTVEMVRDMERKLQADRKAGRYDERD